MLNSFLIVGTQVFILFLLIGLGFLGGRSKVITSDGVKCINDIMLYFVTPCVIINSFLRPFDYVLLKNLVMAIVAAIMSHMAGILLGLIFIKNKDARKKKVLRFSVIFSNCGFMAFPLLEALLGSEGVFYGAGYVAVFNIISWSYGQYIMVDKNQKFSMKKAVLNTGVISAIIAFIIFITQLPIPSVLSTPIGYMAGLNTPVAMLIIGYTMSTIDLKSLLKIKELLHALALRNIIIPLVMLGVLYALGYRGILFTACVVSVSAPVAAMTTMFSIKYNADEALASKMVAVSTLFSILSMTLIVGFAGFIS